MLMMIAYCKPRGYQTRVWKDVFTLTRGAPFIHYLAPESTYVHEYASISRQQVPGYAEHRGKWLPTKLLAAYEDIKQRLGRQQEKPKLLILNGKAATFLFLGLDSSDYRGSLVMSDLGIKCLVLDDYRPYYHDQLTCKLLKLDYSRAVAASQTAELKLAEEDFLLKPTFAQIVEWLAAAIKQVKERPTRVTLDVETWSFYITEIGLTLDGKSVLVIPFIYKGHYLSEAEEAQVVYLLRHLLTHENALACGQNLAYDFQRIKENWGFWPHFYQDIMADHHILFPTWPNNLGFLSSIYRDTHLYWKGIDWKAVDFNDDKNCWERWLYNARDVAATHEIAGKLDAQIRAAELEGPRAIQRALFMPVLRMQERGFLCDTERRSGMLRETKVLSAKVLADIHYMADGPLNPNSSPQMKDFLYRQLRLKPALKQGKPSCDEAALTTLAGRNPGLQPFFNAVLVYRAYMKLIGTYLQMKLENGRIKTSFNISGTKTMRFSSSKTINGTGGNMQNIPEGRELLGYAMPNIRELHIPDPGMTLFDVDLSGADFQVVVWVANDALFKEILRKGVDVHLHNNFTIRGLDISDDEIIKGTDSCEKLAKQHKKERQQSKKFIHSINYRSTAAAAAKPAGITTQEGERFRDLYFQNHPAIKAWHGRIERSLHTTGMIKNIWGYRCQFDASKDSELREATAWEPQSTVAITINKLLIALDKYSSIQLLNQVHDSLVGQFPTDQLVEHLEIIENEAAKIVLPYEGDPLVIPISINTSSVSWGACK